MLGSQTTLFVRSIVEYWVTNRWSRRMRSDMASSLERIMPAWERPVSCHCLASRRKSLWLKVKMARPWLVANVNCASSVHPKFHASRVVTQSIPRACSTAATVRGICSSR